MYAVVFYRVQIIVFEELFNLEAIVQKLKQTVNVSMHFLLGSGCNEVWSAFSPELQH